MFTAVCRFCWNIGGLIPLIYIITDKQYKDNGVDFGLLSHLDTLGLIHFNNLASYDRGDFPPKFQMSYGDQRYLVEMPEGKERLPTGSVVLTATGQQLAPLSNAKVVPGYDAFVIDQLKKSKITVSRQPKSQRLGTYSRQEESTS